MSYKRAPDLQFWTLTLTTFPILCALFRTWYSTWFFLSTYEELSSWRYVCVSIVILDFIYILSHCISSKIFLCVTCVSSYYKFVTTRTLSFPWQTQLTAAEIAATKKKRTFRKFTFRGVDLDQLLDMNYEQLMTLVHARARRRFSRGMSTSIDHCTCGVCPYHCHIYDAIRAKYIYHRIAVKFGGQPCDRRIKNPPIPAL